VAAFEPFEIAKSTFGSLLSTFQAEVPDLQRSFAWTDEQAQDLIRDVIYLVDELKQAPDRNPKPQHFIGTIVTISSGGRARVIDGQQRLTTTTLLLGLVHSALIELWKKIERLGRQHPQREGLEWRVKQLDNQVQSYLFKTSYNRTSPGLKPEDLRFYPSPEISKTYFSLVTGGDGKIETEVRLPAVRMRTIAKLLNTDLIKEKSRFGDLQLAEQIDHLQRVFDVVTGHLVFVVVDTRSPAAGYQLFESLNATGKPLNALDLLKVWMLAVLEGGTESKRVSEQFRDLANDDAKEAKSFIIDYFRAKTFTNAGNPSDKELSLIVRGRLFKDPSVPAQHRAVDASDAALSDRIAHHVDVMTNWLNPWRSLNSGRIPTKIQATPFDHERYILLNNGLLRHSLAMPLFMQASEHLQSAEFCRLVHLIERFFFRYKTVCSGPISALENEYQRATRAIDTNGQLDLNAFATKLSDLTSEHASDAKFKLSLSEKIRYDKSIPRLNYFLRTLDLYEANPRPARIPQLDLNYTLEHINPRNPRVGQPLNDALLHSMGNICLLTPPENALLRNHEFAVKKADLNNGINCTATLTRAVFTDPRSDWDADAVMDREQTLISKALGVFTPNVF
jgi:hypothetical protein